MAVVTVGQKVVTHKAFTDCLGRYHPAVTAVHRAYTMYVPDSSQDMVVLGMRMEQLRLYRNTWGRQHPEVNWRRRASMLEAEGSFTSSEFDALCAVLDYRCIYCGRSRADVGSLMPDHFIPVSRGGSNDIDNIVPACKSCNSSKGNKLPMEFVKVIVKEVCFG